MESVGGSEERGTLAPEAQTVMAPGHGPLSPPLFDSVLAALSCSCSLLGGKMAASSSQQPQQKKKKIEAMLLLTGQTEVPRLSLSGRVGVSARLCTCRCGYRGVRAHVG